MTERCTCPEPDSSGRLDGGVEMCMNCGEEIGPHVCRIDRYVIEVGTVRFVADLDQESRIRAMSPQERARLETTMGAGSGLR